ncbi:hepatic lectin-like [Scyliorhinus canicula]|uniref:hepatic lectin-like n=1 Tax=Scyliorhinus canicula TaxID=7830 RepID=UPI0018F3A4B9|nr:hepatic lectin-like [Scyliorhinus canicula]
MADRDIDCPMDLDKITNILKFSIPDKTGQETDGGRCSITSIHLGLAALIVLIFTLAIAIGLRVHALSVNKECDRANLCNDTSNEAQLRLTDLNAKLRDCARRHKLALKRNNSLCQFLNIHSESLCPCGWQVHNQNCYKFSMDRKDWNTAKQQCESLNSHLIIINTPEEQNFITEIQTKLNERVYLIGLTDQESEGNWTWLDFTPVGFASWYYGQPDNWKNKEDCASILTKDGKTFGWNDVGCSDHFPFICEKMSLPLSKLLNLRNVVPEESGTQNEMLRMV